MKLFSVFWQPFFFIFITLSPLLFVIHLRCLFILHITSTITCNYVSFFELSLNILYFNLFSNVNRISPKCRFSPPKCSYLYFITKIFCIFIHIINLCIRQAFCSIPFPRSQCNLWQTVLLHQYCF